MVRAVHGGPVELLGENEETDVFPPCDADQPPVTIRDPFSSTLLVMVVNELIDIIFENLCDRQVRLLFIYGYNLPSSTTNSTQSTNLYLTSADTSLEGFDNVQLDTGSFANLQPQELHHSSSTHLFFNPQVACFFSVLVLYYATHL